MTDHYICLCIDLHNCFNLLSRVLYTVNSCWCISSSTHVHMQICYAWVYVNVPYVPLYVCYVCMYNIYINRVQRIRKCYDYINVFCHTATIGEHSALIVPLGYQFQSML